jgi:hypothetical protein
MHQKNQRKELEFHRRSPAVLAAAKEDGIHVLSLANILDSGSSGLGAGAVRLDGPPLETGDGADAADDAAAAVAAKGHLRAGNAAGGAHVGLGGGGRGR